MQFDQLRQLRAEIVGLQCRAAALGLPISNATADLVRSIDESACLHCGKPLLPDHGPGSRNHWHFFESAAKSDKSASHDAPRIAPSGGDGV